MTNIQVFKIISIKNGIVKEKIVQKRNMAIVHTKNSKDKNNTKTAMNMNKFMIYNKMCL